MNRASSRSTFLAISERGRPIPTTMGSNFRTCRAHLPFHLLNFRASSPCLRCSLRSNPAIVLTEDPFRVALFHKVQYGRFMFDEIRPSTVRTP